MKYLLLSLSILTSLSSSAHWGRDRSGVNCESIGPKLYDQTSLSCHAIQKDIAFYAIGRATLKWRELCHVKDYGGDITDTYTISKIEYGQQVRSQYWYSATEAVKECEALL